MMILSMAFKASFNAKTITVHKEIVFMQETSELDNTSTSKRLDFLKRQRRDIL